MDHQEKHRQQKEKERERKNKKERAYEEVQEKRRLPVNSVWLVVVGVILTAMAVYVWTLGMFRTPN
jgi:cytoskeletal protein RodZ